MVKDLKPIGETRLAAIYLVGATTRAGAISAPLRDRFGVLSRLEYYNEEQLTDIVVRTAEILDTEIDMTRQQSKLRDGHVEPQNCQSIVETCPRFCSSKRKWYISHYTWLKKHLNYYKLIAWA